MVRKDALLRLGYFLIFICAQACAEVPRAHFDIPAGNARKTLPEFYEQSNVEMLYLTDTIRDKKTQAVLGTYEVTRALELMLRETGLVISFNGDFSFVSITPPVVKTAEVPAGDSVVSAEKGREPTSSVRFTPVNESELAEVRITGTLLRVALDSPSPLNVVNRGEVRRARYADIREVLQDIPLVFGGGPSEDFGTTGNFARGTSVNLRGLGAGATLVLLNGRRLPPAGIEGDFIDLSHIPWAAVDKIEVLPDGASATYGADAIAGVVNVITRSDENALESLARAGSAIGGADEKLFSQLVAGSWRSGTALISYQYNKRGALAASERAYSASSDKTSLGGTDYRTFQSFPPNILNPTTLQPAYGIPLLGDGRSPTLGDLTTDINYLDQNANLALLPERESHSVFFSGRQELPEGVELFAEGRYSKRRDALEYYGITQRLVVPPSNPFFINPYAAPYTVVAYSFLRDLGPTFVDSLAISKGATLGAEWKVGRWRALLTGTRNDELMSFVGRNQVNFEALVAALSDPNPLTAFNPFAPGRSPAGTVEAIRWNVMADVHSSVTAGSLVADGPILALGAGDVQFAVGVERRREALDRNFPVPGSFDRSVSSVYSELNVPLIGDPTDARKAPRLEITFAGRFEQYSDFGSTTNPKFGFRWAPLDSFKLRGSFGRSFRAPRLPEQFDPNRNLSSVTSFPDPASRSGRSTVISHNGVREDLTRETASTWNIGIDIASPWRDGLDMSMTYYSIEYRDRIANPGPLIRSEIFLQESIWADVIHRNPARDDVLAICSSPNFRGSVEQCKNTPIDAIVDFRLANFARTHVDGLDVRLEQKFAALGGKSALRVSGSWINRFSQALSQSSPFVGFESTVGFPPTFKMRAEFDWFQQAWDKPGFGLTLGLAHVGEYRDVDREGRSVDAATTLDVRASFRTRRDMQPDLFAGMEFALSASNIFNSAPPWVDRELGYDAQAADPYGRIISFQIEKQW